MKSYRTFYIAAVAVITGSTQLCFAQSAPPADTSSPSSASSPHQRSATDSKASESPTTNGTNPAAASSPHQAEVIAGPKSHDSAQNEAKQTMKTCMVREQADHTGMSQADAKKSCKEQLKVSPKSQ